MENVKQSENYFAQEQIDTFVGLGKNGSDFDKNGNLIGERRKLVVLHQNGSNKKALIGQLKTLIEGLKTDFESFAV